MFLKEKRCGSIKGQTCADGQKQCEVAHNKDATSLTVMLELVLIASVTNTHKRRGMDLIDIPGTLLTAYVDKEVIIVLWERLAELMVKTETSIYRKFVKIKNGRMVLYVKIQKELYVCLRSVISFYENMVSDLK